MTKSKEKLLELHCECCGSISDRDAEVYEIVNDDYGFVYREFLAEWACNSCEKEQSSKVTRKEFE